MTRYYFKSAKFVKTAVLHKDYPVIRDAGGRIMPEIAVVGRSNVGKSSLLNHLFKNKSLVRVSATPGKTQTINFFATDDGLACVDLPGYGYAKAPIATRKQWAPMVQEYLENRETLVLILVLLDIRREPNDEDKALIEWIQYYEKPMLLVLTKVDKVNRQERTANTHKILRELNLENAHHVHYSVTENEGREHLISSINKCLR